MNQKTAMQNRDLEAVFHPMTDMSRLSNDGPLMVVRGKVFTFMMRTIIST